MAPGTCTPDKCVRPPWRRGLCKTCANRQYKRAEALGLSPVSMTDAEFAAIPKTRQVGKHPLNRTYWSMVYRCSYPGHPRYTDYGGRGITVCPTWLAPPRGQGIANYVADMWPPPTTDQRWTVDRIDNDGPYCGGRCGGTCGYGTTGNVRWATYAEQRQNQRQRDMTCQMCGAPFIATTSKARWCSNKCAGKARRAQRPTLTGTAAES